MEMTRHMRKAGMVLGMIGGVLDAIIGLVVIFGGTFLVRLYSRIGDVEVLQGLGAGVLTGVMIIAGLLILIAAAVAIIGAANAMKRPVLGGILMIIAGAPNILFNVPGLIIALILIVAGILALVGAKELKVAAPPPGA